MNDEQIKQRIQYLIEHGGVWDDPLAEIRRRSRWGFWLGAVVLFTHAIDLGLKLI